MGASGLGGFMGGGPDWGRNGIAGGGNIDWARLSPRPAIWAAR